MSAAIGPDGATRAALVAFLAYLAVERTFELVRSAGNARRVRARGGIERGRRHLPLIVLVHVVFPLALVAEVVLLGARPGPAWPAWLALWGAAQALRWWCMAALGERWNVRIWVVPGEAPSRRGPYRWLRHPNYLAVVVELIAAPLAFGAWRTAVAVSLLNALALRIRIRAENEALLGGLDA